MRTEGRRLHLLVLILCFVDAPRAFAQPIDSNSSLASLGRIWGLLKYHPGTARQAGVDDRLVTAIPRFRAATTRAAFDEEAQALLRQSGQAFAFRATPADVSASIALTPAVGWIDADPNLGASMRAALKDVVLAHRGGANNYVASAGSSSNPDFSRDVAYNTPIVAFPSEEVRLLALFRYWNMVQYYFPCSDVIGRDWSGVLDEMVPVFRQASNAVEYHLAVARLIAAINDAHATMSSAVLDGYWGANIAPVRIRLVEGKTVVVRVYRDLVAGADLRVGDVITAIDGVGVEERRASLRPFLSGSNEASLERVIHTVLGKTTGSSMTLVRERDGVLTSVVVPAYPLSRISADILAFESENFKLVDVLAGNIGYVHMGVLQRADVPAVMNQLRNTRGIVFDLRTYPNTTLYDVLNYLNPTARPFVKFMEPDYGRPGTMVPRGPLTAGPGSANAWFPTFPPFFKYEGRVVVLINQETISQSEYTAMAFKTVTGAILIGGQTAGADGNVSMIVLPGGITTYFSGLGVFYPDDRPTQRIGIVADQIVNPTIAGLRAGRDEQLEAALQVLR